MRQELSDKSLSLANGNVTAFDDIYYTYHQAVYANILKTVRLSDVAEDILQDVFLALWENRAKIDESRVANWLFVVSFNKSLTFLKKQTRISLSSHSQHTDIENISNDEPIEEEEMQMLLGILEEAIEQLSDRKKEIFNFYRFQGVSVEEISRQFGISVATVKDHLTLSNRQIRSYILENRNLSFLLALVISVLIEGAYLS